MILPISVVLYTISLFEDGLRGRTRLQKIIFLVQERVREKTKTEIEIDFQPAQFGPYSTDLSGLMELLKNQKIISEEEIGDEKVLHIFKLEADGKKLANDAKKQMPTGIKKIVDDVVKEYGALSLNELLDKVHREYPKYVRNI